MTAYLHLGRYGDIINTLPLLKWLADRSGEPVRLIVAEKYTDVLDGVSYVIPLVYPGEFPELLQAIAWGRTKGYRVINLQVYGHGHHQSRLERSFCVEQWRNGGHQNLFGLPLVFDRRDEARERRLLAQHDGKGPLVLVAGAGFSSPFTHADAMLADIRKRFPSAHVVDLSAVRAHRIYDLLGLFDAASCLVTIDTAHAHLAIGSKVPTVMWATDRPTMWHGAPERKGQVFYGRYGEYEQRRDEMLEAIASLVKTKKRPQVKDKVQRIVHVYPAHHMTGEALRRHRAAKETWKRCADITPWVDLPMAPSMAPRTANDIGEQRDLIYMRDLIDFGRQVAKPSDIILVSNSDVAFVEGFSHDVLSAIEQHGAFFTHRWDMPGRLRTLSREEVKRMKWYPGSDVFGFSRVWWDKHGTRFPDMITGAEFVDAVLRQLIKQRAAPTAEIHAAVYHEKHVSHWERNRNSAAQVHNRLLAEAWFRKHGTDDLDPFGPKQAARIRAGRK